MKSKNLMIFIIGAVLITEPSFSQDNLPMIDVRALSSNLYRFSCGVNNWIVLVGPDGVLLSDSAPEIYSEAMKEELKKLGNDDVNIIINTHWHHDHTGGNLLFGKDAIIIAHNSVRGDLSTRNQVSLFNEFFKAYPDYALPSLTFTSCLKIYFNGEEIAIKHFPNGHTEGDAVVYFKNANVIHVGDMIVMDNFPPIDLDNGGDVEQLVENLRIIISEISSDTKIISGHLHDASKRNLIEYCDMLSSTIEIVKEEMKLGVSLKDMQKNEILKEWKDWGQHVSCDMWIETIYKCMK